MSKINQAVCLVTGASSGIGEALAYQLNALGAKVILSARRLSELERVKANCSNPENTAILVMDLGDVSSIPAKAQEAETYFGPIDILVNCGGISQRDLIINTSLEVDRKLMEVNYFGSITLTKALLPGMIERQSGHQVIITSAVGIISGPLRSAYAAAKHALHGFYDSLRAEHHNDHIRVSIILPGFIKTNISINALKGDGSNQNTMDQAQANGLSPEACARQIIKAIQKNKEEVYIGGFKEVAGIYLKRFFPKLFSTIIRKVAVT